MRVRSRGNLGFILLSSIIFVPSLIYVSLDAASTSWGLLFSLALIMCILRKPYKILPYTPSSGIFISFTVLFFLHALISSIISGNSRSYLFLVGFLLIYFGANFIGNYLRKLSVSAIRRTVYWSSFLSLFFLYFALIMDVKILNYSNYVANVFPFSEPSHFAISTVGIIFVSTFIASPQTQLVLISSVFLGGILLPSLTLVVIGLILSLVFLTRSSTLVKSIFVIALTIVLFSFQEKINGLDYSYYSSRIDFSIDNRNVSALSYMQGWSRALIAFIETYGLGVGVHNFESVRVGRYGLIIQDLVGIEKKQNLADGGFMAAKLIGEFGAIGVALLITYIKLAFNSVLNLLKLNRITKNGMRNLDENYYIAVLANSFVIVFSIDLFLRGTSYFSTGAVLFFIGLFSIRHLKHITTLHS